LLDTDYRPTDNRPVPYRCTSNNYHSNRTPVK